MIGPEDYEFEELYVIEKTVECVHEGRVFRIEAVQDLANGRYSTRAYERDTVKLQPEYPRANGTYERSPTEFSLWRSVNSGQGRGDTADEALDQALRFLQLSINSEGL